MRPHGYPRQRGHRVGGRRCVRSDRAQRASSNQDGCRFSTTPPVRIFSLSISHRLHKLLLAFGGVDILPFFSTTATEPLGNYPTCPPTRPIPALGPHTRSYLYRRACSTRPSPMGSLQILTEKKDTGEFYVSDPCRSGGFNGVQLPCRLYASSRSRSQGALVTRERQEIPVTRQIVHVSLYTRSNVATTRLTNSGGSV